MKTNKGITLIALVVTIIVLLILAGVSINLLLGENGVITKSKEASETHKKAALEEDIYMMLADYKAEEVLTGKDLKTYLTEKGKDYEEDANGNIIIGNEEYIGTIDVKKLEVISIEKADRAAWINLTGRVVGKNDPLKAILKLGKEVDIENSKYVFTANENESEANITGEIPNNLEINNLPTNQIGEYYFHLKVVYKDGTSTIKKVKVVVGIPVTAVNLSETSKTVTKLDTFTLTIGKTPTNGTIDTVDWTSSNTNVAEVDQNGNVTTKAVGTAIITVKVNNDENVKATCNLTVNPILAQSITISPETANAYIGETTTLTAQVLPNTADNQNVTWSSSDNTIATVNSSTGVVTGISAGTVVITATAADGSGVYGTKDVTVSYKTYSITYNLGGGTNNSNNPSSYTQVSETITLQPPTKTDAMFTGWTYQGQTTPTNPVTIPTGSTGNKSFTANWRTLGVISPISASGSAKSSSYPASQSIDGNKTGKSNGFFPTSSDPYLTIDYGQLHTITKVVIYEFNWSWGPYDSSYTVKGSVNGSTWSSSLGSVNLSGTGTKTNGTPHEIIINSNTDYRYLKIEFSNVVVGTAEVVAYGY